MVQKAMLWLFKKLLGWLVRSMQQKTQEQERHDSPTMEEQPNWVEISYQEIGESSYLAIVDTAQHEGEIFQVIQGTNAQRSETFQDRCKAGLHVREIFSLTVPATIQITKGAGKVATLCTKTDSLQLIIDLNACLAKRVEVLPLQRTQFPVV